jgi:hypothetical protein
MPFFYPGTKFNSCSLNFLIFFMILPAVGIQTALFAQTSAEIAARNNLGNRIPGAKVVWVRNGKIYYSPIKNWNEQKITGAETEGRPRWSPDGSKIVFERQNGSSWDVYTMNSDFSGAKKIITGAHTADWTDNGAAVTAIKYYPGNTAQEGYEVVRHTISSGQTTVIYNAKASGYNGWIVSQTAELHPKGRYLLTFSREDNHHSFIVDLQGKNYIKNDEMWRGDCGPGWAPDGTYFTQTARTSSRPALKTTFNWDNGTVGSSTHFLGMDTNLKYYHHGHRISNDGNWAVGGVLWKEGELSGNREIYVWELADPDRDKNAVRLTFTAKDKEDNSPSIVIGASASEPAMLLTPATLSFSASTGGNNPDAQIVTITNENPDAGVLNKVAVAKKSAWLSIEIGGSDTIQLLTNTVNISGLSGGTHKDTVTVTCENATNSPKSYVVELTVISMRKPDNPTCLASGLNASYYEISSGTKSMPDFNQLSSYKKDSVANINYSQTSGKFAASDRADSVAAVFSGYVDINRDDMYTFYVESDDGAILYIGGIKVVDNDGSHAMKTDSGTIGLQTGKHSFRLEYWEGSGDAGLIVSWSRPGTPKHVITDASFFRIPANEPKFALLSPKTGDVWKAGAKQTIKWTSENVDEAVIELSVDGGLTYLDEVWIVQKKDAANWGQFEWTVPAMASNDCRILIAAYEGKGTTVSGKFEITGGASVMNDRALGTKLLQPDVSIQRTRLLVSLADKLACSISLYNAGGRKAAEFSLRGSDYFAVDIGMLSSGSYIAKVDNRNAATLHRIIVP